MTLLIILAVFGMVFLTGFVLAEISFNTKLGNKLNNKFFGEEVMKEIKG